MTTTTLSKKINLPETPEWLDRYKEVSNSVDLPVTVWMRQVLRGAIRQMDEAGQSKG